MIRKIFAKRPPKRDTPTAVDDREDWVTFRHNGPYFDTLDKVTRAEMIELYRRVPPSSRDKRFWSNCPLPPLEVQKPPRRDTPSEKHPLDVKEVHGYVEIDGRRESVTSWKMEPPGVFIGRGDHELRGVFRRRVLPEDVTLNLDDRAPLPPLPPGRSWGGVVHQRCSYWLWSWVDPVLKKIKYVYPDPSSLNHSLQEKDKFEAARRLKGVIRDIREEYVRVLSTPDADPGRVEFAMILLLIDRLGLRIGNTGSQTGASTLRKEHVQIFPERKKIRVTFVGKDSIPYDQTMYAEGFVLRAMKKLLDTPGEDLFPSTISRDINQYLQTIHPDLKAKVFRTYNASEIFQAYLQKNTKGGMGKGELVGVFKGAGMTVAQFCNHRRLSTLNKLSEKFAPSTSITNYVDPRIGVSWAKRNHVPLPQIYSKNLIKRFDWALDTGEDFSW